MALTIAPPPIADAAPRGGPPGMEMQQRGLTQRDPADLLREAGRSLAEVGEAMPHLAPQMADLVRQIVRIQMEMRETPEEPPPAPMSPGAPAAQPPMMGPPPA